MNIAKLWDIQVRDLWSKNYVDKLSELLKNNGVLYSFKKGMG